MPLQPMPLQSSFRLSLPTTIIPAQAGIYTLPFFRHSGASRNLHAAIFRHSGASRNPRAAIFRHSGESRNLHAAIFRHSGASRNLRVAIFPSFRLAPESTRCHFPSFRRKPESTRRDFSVIPAQAGIYARNHPKRKTLQPHRTRTADCRPTAAIPIIRRREYRRMPIDNSRQRQYHPLRRRAGRPPAAGRYGTNHNPGGPT